MNYKKALNFLFRFFTVIIYFSIPMLDNHWKLPMILYLLYGAVFNSLYSIVSLIVLFSIICYLLFLFKNKYESTYTLLLILLITLIPLLFFTLARMQLDSLNSYIDFFVISGLYIIMFIISILFFSSIIKK